MTSLTIFGDRARSIRAGPNLLENDTWEWKSQNISHVILTVSYRKFCFAPKKICCSSEKFLEGLVINELWGKYPKEEMAVPLVACELDSVRSAHANAIHYALR